MSEPKKGDTVEVISCVHNGAPVGSMWQVDGVYDGVMAPGRYLSLSGCPVSMRVDRCRIVCEAE